MAKGQKYNDDIREKAIALLTVNNSVSFVARELGLPRSTVKSWKEAFDKEAEESGEDNIAKLRQKRKRTSSMTLGDSSTSPKASSKRDSRGRRITRKPLMNSWRKFVN